MLRRVRLLCALAVVAATTDARAQRVDGAFELSTPAPRSQRPGTPAATSPTAAPTQGLPPAPSVGDARDAYDAGDVEVGLRLDALDDHLSALTLRRQNRVGDGLIPILIGGTYVGIGVAVNRHGSDDAIGRYFLLTGSASIASGAIHFGLQTNPERAYDAFRSATGGDLQRVRVGEQRLRNMARKRMSARYVQGAIDLGITAASLPLLFGGDGFSTGEPFDWIIGVGASISMIQSITGMLQRSEEERRYRAYRDLLEGRAAGADVARTRFLGLYASPLPGGLTGGAALAF